MLYKKRKNLIEILLKSNFNNLNLDDNLKGLVDDYIEKININKKYINTKNILIDFIELIYNKNYIDSIVDYISSSIDDDKTIKFIEKLVDFRFSNQINFEDDYLFNMISLIFITKLCLKIENLKKSLIININSHLISISNTENDDVRLLLLHYFSAQKSDNQIFYKAFNRFGSNVLNYLFTKLHVKDKSKQKIYVFLLKNIFTKILYSKNSTKYILFENMKSNIFNEFSHIIKFLNHYCLYVNNNIQKEIIYDNLLLLISKLIIVADEFNMRNITRKILNIMFKMKENKNYNKYINFLKLNLKNKKYMIKNLKNYLKVS